MCRYARMVTYVCIITYDYVRIVIYMIAIYIYMITNIWVCMYGCGRMVRHMYAYVCMVMHGCMYVR